MSYPTMSINVPWSLVKGGFHKTPHFNSQTQKPAAGRGRSALSFQPYASWDFAVDLSMIQGGVQVRGSVLQQFVGCFMASCGSGGFFLFTDPADYAVENPDGTDGSDQSLLLDVTAGSTTPMQNVCNGTSTQFQLARQVDQGVDILQFVSGVTLFANGSPITSGYTIGTALGEGYPPGVVVFTTPPAAGTVLTWQGSFQYLCQFTEDTIKDLAITNKNTSGWLWTAGQIEFESAFV